MASVWCQGEIFKVVFLFCSFLFFSFSFLVKGPRDAKNGIFSKRKGVDEEGFFKSEIDGTEWSRTERNRTDRREEERLREVINRGKKKKKKKKKEEKEKEKKKK